MEEVGELHVYGFHGACVLHDPVFVHIGGIVVAGGAKITHRKQRERNKCKEHCLRLTLGDCRCTLAPA